MLTLSEKKLAALKGKMVRYTTPTNITETGIIVSIEKDGKADIRLFRQKATRDIIRDVSFGRGPHTWRLKYPFANNL